MEYSNESINICEWNINNRGGWGHVGSAPEWVVDELKDQDIVILTEFPTEAQEASRDNRFSIIRGLQNSGFACFPSDNREGNDVLIAVKKSLITESKPELQCTNPYRNQDGLTPENEIPENAFVELKIGDRDLVVVGVRIRTVKDFKARKAQFDSLMKELKKLFPNRALLIAGDWNHGRANSKNPDWSLTAMTNCLKRMNYSVYPIEGSSIYQENGCCDFPDDHFVVNQAMLCLEKVKYDRDFTERNSSIYQWGRNFRNRPSNKGESVKPPYPDHAVLKATLSFAN